MEFTSSLIITKCWVFLHLLSVLGPTHMGGRPATCAYWVDYTQAHVVQWWPGTSSSNDVIIEQSEDTQQSTLV